MSEPLTPEEEAQWRSWLAAGHMPFGTPAMQGERIARLLATLDATRKLADEGLAGEPDEEYPDTLRETLRMALPRAINFRFLPPRIVSDAIWGEVADELVAALDAAVKEMP